jgi:hypothetical protein
MLAMWSPPARAIPFEVSISPALAPIIGFDPFCA